MSLEPTTAPTSCYRHPDRKAGVRCQRCERPICPSCMATASVGFHCPECARGGRQKVLTGAQTFGRAAMGTPAVTYTLIAANVAVFLAGLAERRQDALAGRSGFITDGGLYGPLVADGEWWRIVSSGFLHAGLLHLAFNMFALYQLGLALEPTLGRLRFAILYGGSLLAGSLGVLVVDPNALTVGASGAVFGLMGGLVAAMRERGINPFQTNVGGILLINLLFTFTIPGISIGGHVGGLVGGYLLGSVLGTAGRRALGSETLATVAAAAAGLGLGAACLFVA